MAHARRLPQHRAPSSSISSPSTTRRKTLRRAARRLAPDASTEFISSPLPHGHRLPLLPLQANLRRLPSRIRFAAKGGDFHPQMREGLHVTVGSKRKRTATGNENALANGRGMRHSKRRRTASEIRRRGFFSSSEESQSEDEMEVDNSTVVSTQSGENEQELEELEDDDDDDDSDEFFLNEASPKRLNKLLKKRLVELYALTGLTEFADSLKKSEIVDAIINARDDTPLAPPSSPGRTDCASSEYPSSDDGNAAGDETDSPDPQHPPSGQLIRRATIHDVSKLTPRPRNTKGRSASMGNMTGHGESSSQADKTSENPRRRASARSSPTTSANAPFVTQQPPVTRLRSRQASGSLTNPTSPSSKTKGKGKSKQVEFSNAVEVHLQSPSKSLKGKKKLSSNTSDAESKLSDDVANVQSQPSPRRLRSKGRERESLKEIEDSQATPVSNLRRRPVTRKAESEEVENDPQRKRKLRVTPMRQAKVKVGDPQESELDEEEGEEENSQDDEEEEAEEVDELVSSASLSPPPESNGQRNPTMRRLLRPRTKRVKAVPTAEEENEGDDEEELAEDMEQDDEGDDESESDVENDEDTVTLEPKKLRSGKIVGEEEFVEEEGGDEEEEEGEGEEEEEEGEGEEEEGREEEEEGEGEEESMEVDQESVAIDDEVDDDTLDDTASVEGSDSVDQEHQDQDEAMEDDVDLTVATAKMLVRLRRDDLVRLCESREIEPSGTKPQLAEALLQWRDRHSNDLSSPSSTGTVRAPSHRRNRRTRKDSDMTTTTDVPVLLRSHHVHHDEPRTPVPERENEDLELDLESLGLDDREIPPEKLTKLEKIGSGGFKDVFIGKFKGRKVAIAEFRGQLSAMDIKELKLLGAFHHNNIVRFVGVSIPENTKESPVMIISELCSNGDLFDYIRNEKAPSLHKVLKLMFDIARGLEYLHTRKPSIIHRDCKSSNILITAKGVAKIADFGLAKVKQSTRSMVRSLVGTVNWQAPELWTAHPRYDHKVDVFSCAMVFWEVLQWHLPDKKFPWEGMNEHAIYDLVGAKKQRPSTAGLKKQWCPEVIELIEHMWSQEPQDRPAISEVVGSLEGLYAKY